MPIKPIPAQLMGELTMNRNSELPLPSYPVANFVPHSLPDAEVAKLPLPYQDEPPTSWRGNPGAESILASASQDGLSAVFKSEYLSRPAPNRSEGASPWLRNAICRKLGAFDVLFSVSIVGAFVGAFYMLARVL
jgi:hypothetical protein